MQAPQSTTAAQDLAVLKPLSPLLSSAGPTPPGSARPVTEAHAPCLAAADSPASVPSVPLSAAALTHDAGNFLAAFGLYCDLLEAPGVLRPEHRHYAAELRLLCEHSVSLVRQALVAAPALPPTSVLCDAALTLRTLLPVFKKVAAPSAEVTLDLAPGLPLACVPTQALERIVLNLVRNAAQAIANSPSRSPLQPGRIRIGLAVHAAALQLTVQDNGPGMPPALAAAFLRPSPLPLGATRGFGHRIVHELAASSGGSLSLRVRPGFGTTFSLKWPLHAPEGPAC